MDYTACSLDTSEPKWVTAFRSRQTSNTLDNNVLEIFYDRAGGSVEWQNRSSVRAGCAEVLTEEYKVEVRPHQGLDQNFRPALEPSAGEAAEPKVRELQPTDV